MNDDSKREAAELQVGQAQVVWHDEHAGDVATDAQRAASETLCPECDRQWGSDHAPDCVLRPHFVPRYEDYLRELRASRPWEYWGGRFDYLSDYQK